ncbi:MAG: glycosyltransferase family 4 protein [Verrucomicrobiota bacterium]
MKVIICNDFASVRGGADEVAIAESRGLADAGHQVVFAAGSGEEVDGRLRHAGITVELFGQVSIRRGDANSKNAFISGLWNGDSGSKLSRVLADHAGPDTMVHVHGWTKALTSAALKAIRDSGLPQVVTLHDYFAACPNGALFDFQDGAPCPRAPMGLSCCAAQCDRRGRVHKIWRLARHGVLRARAGWPAAVRHSIAVSRLSESKIRPFLSKQNQTYLLPNPIDLRKQPAAAPAENKTFIYAGRLTQEKGVLNFARAAAAAGVDCLFVGTGDCQEEILRINPSAQVPGWLPREKLVELMMRSRAFVFPSLWWETQGMVCLEALACGLPVIASTTTGAAEWVIPGENGLHTDMTDPDSLTNALRALAADDGKVRAMGQNAWRRYWENPSTLERHIDGLSGIYSQVMADYA